MMNTREEADENAFKPIYDNPIVLDFTGCRHWDEVHNILKERFGFPEYYGKNWSALWDCLSYHFYGEGERLVEIRGFYSLPADLREVCMKMLEIFHRTHEETPNVIFRLIS